MERFAIKIDKTLRANLYKICRLCGIDNPDKIKVRDDANIVNLEDGEPELWKKVFDCIGLMITKDDKMPQFMCTLCVDKINDFFEFREMCYATDGQTRKLLGIKAEPKIKAPAIVPCSSVDLKCEDIKEPLPEVTPLRAGRKRRNADMEVITKDIKIDINDDIKPSTTNIPTSSATKKKRIKLSNATETETKIEPGTGTGRQPKKEPAPRVTPKSEPLGKIALSKKRLKAEPIVKENKKDTRSAKLTKIMKKKLKVEVPTEVLLPEPTKKKKVELIKLKKQLVVKAEKLKKGMLETKIKEETPITSDPQPALAPAASSKINPKLKLKCMICSEAFVNKLNLDKHVKATHIPTIQRYHCVQCNETLKKNMEIKNHNLWHKLSKTPFKCGKCSETSCSIYTYTKHIRDCSPIAYLDTHIPDWHCPDCSGNYETTYLFNIHSCVSKGLVCPGCEKSLKWKEDYLKHIPTCAEAFQRIPPYMTSNIQVKNEAELPTSPIPPLNTIALPTTTIPSVTVQSTSSARVCPPQMDSNQCVVIPGNISLHDEAGSSSPSKSSRKGKRITKKDLKRFDKLLKSTMTTLVSIKHEPTQGEDPSLADDDKPSSSEVKDQSEPPPLESPPGSPMPCGGDDFHHNGDDSDSADEQTPTKPVGTIKQEIIDEGYRDLYNNIEVNIKHEIDVNKTTEEEATHKKTDEDSTSPLAPKPILKLKITKEHGTLNSILMDSPKSEKKKKKKKRKEDRNKSPEKDERSSAANDTSATAAVTVNNEVPVEINLPENEHLALVSNNPVVSEVADEEPPMPLPEIINIKKEINIPEEDEGEKKEDQEASSQNTPSIIAATSGSLQISCVSEGVIFTRSDETEESMPQETPYSSEEHVNLTPEEPPADWVEPIPSMELSLSSKEFTSLPLVDGASSLVEYPTTQETEEEEIDIKPRLEDLIPMLQIASVTSGAEVVEKPIRKPVKRKRRQPTAPKSNPVPKIVSVSSGNEVASYHPQSDVSSADEAGEDFSKKRAENNENNFDFSQVSIKEEIVDPAYEEHQEEREENEVEEDIAEDDEDEEEKEEDEEEEEAEKDNEEAEKNEEEEAEKNEEEEAEVEAEEQQEVEEDVQMESVISKKQAEENAYIANIDFNNLTIKQEKEYIDDGLENSVYEELEDNEEDEEEEDDDEDEECSDNDSEEVSSDDDSNKSDSESEREYRDLPSDDEQQVATTIAVVKEKETPPTSQPQLGLQILTVHSEFNCPQTSKKTESEEKSSDDKLSLNSTTTELLETEKKVIDLNECQSKPESFGITKNENLTEGLMEVDCELQTTSNLKDLKTTSETEKSIIYGESPQPPRIELTCVESTDQTLISCPNNLDTFDKEDERNKTYVTETNLESQKSTELKILNEPSSCGTNLESTNLAKVCDDLENKVNEPNPCSYNEEPALLSQEEVPMEMNSQETAMTNDLDRGLYPEVSNASSTSGLESLGVMASTDTEIQSVNNDQATSDVLMIGSNNPFQSIGEVFDVETAAIQNANAYQDTEVKESGKLPNFSQLTGAGLCPSQEYCPVGLVEADISCPTPETAAAGENLCELQPLNDVQLNSPVISTPVHALIDSHLPGALNSYSSIDDHISYKGDMGPPQNPLPTNLSAPTNHTPNAFENTTTLLDLGHSLGNSIPNMEPSYNHHDTQEVTPNSQLTSESGFNILPPSHPPTSPMEFQQFSTPGSSYTTTAAAVAYNCTSDPSNYTDYLSPPTAGQLQTSLVQQPVVVHESPEMSSTSLTNLSVLSEEVQNLLNEDAVAVNNFEFNESVLRSRSAAIAPPPNSNPNPDPVPIFNDFENLNEIAENNNNANIERELQDELGNVLADAIADRSNDDVVDDNNAMNENRANFDIT
ncbi:uncharacterized protein LOC129939347 [Eupeodes corollae]|uniref:uncharacterized protein LOC129939347 n=1 Tax=Eupeodes corollae TaxID=290404 RepID=UPI00249007D8|nr:uncharacterized protein LOC129939347 [Eupeodes corollae]